MHGPFATVSDFNPVSGSPAENQVGAFARIKEILGGAMQNRATTIPAILPLLLDNDD